jgi:hypothetical protein
MPDFNLLHHTRFFLTGVRVCIVMLFMVGAPPAIAMQHEILKMDDSKAGFIHLNNNVFASGDILRYAAYLNNVSGSRPFNPVTVFYFDLINPQNKTIIHWRANASKGISTGNLQLPDSLSTGIYLIRVYTHCMLMKYPGVIPQKPIVVVNISDENPAAMPLPLSMDDVLQNTAAIPEGPLRITSRMIQINTGDSLSFGIEIPASYPIESACFSISVEKSAFPEWNSFILDSVLENKNVGSTKITLPDLRDREPTNTPGCIIEAGFYLLSGRVYNPQSGMPYKNRVVFISYSDTIAQLKYSLTDENGNFCFYLDESYDNKNLVLQVDGLKNIEKAQWDIHPKRVLSETLPGVSARVAITPIYTQQLEEIRKLSVADRIFNPLTRKVNAGNNTFQRHFFSTPSYTVSPADFIHLDDFSDIANNILPRVIFRKSGEKFTTGMGDSDNLTINYGNVLFLLDGHPFQNLEILSGLSSYDIRSIDVVHTPFMYGNLTYNGLVSVRTSVGISLSADIFDSPIYIVDNPVHGEQYVASKDNNNTKCFSSSVLWVPSAILKKEEPLMLTTPMLHFKGDYVIRVAGFTDKGETIQQVIRFSVIGK